jgi:hypothetical protein
VDPEDDEDRLTWVTLGGIPFPYDLAFCDLSDCDPEFYVLAAKRLEAKVKHFQLDDGWVALDVPRNYPEAMRHRRSPQLWQAMINEMHSQLDTKSHYLVPRPTDDTFVHTLGWVYDFKLKDGAIADKARLIGHGNNSVLGTHFFDKTAQVARASSVRTICAYAAQYNLTLTAGDVPTAYLQSFLHNVIIAFCLSLFLRGPGRRCRYCGSGCRVGDRAPYAKSGALRRQPGLTVHRSFTRPEAPYRNRG